MSIHKGEFNSMLKKTGFLAQPKMEARLIARHPQRFLENYADRKIGILSSENDALEQFLDQVKGAGDYQKKQAILTKKQAECKQKTFLLTLASSPAASPDLMEDVLLTSNNSSSTNDEEAAQPDYNAIIQHYLDGIKMANKEHIEEWIATNVDSQVMKLPYGLPQNLRMPRDPTNIEDHAICNFVETATDEFLLLDGEYHTKIEAINKKMGQNSAYIINSNWTVAESALLYYIMNLLEESPDPTSLKLQKDLTKKLFPNKSQENVISQKYVLKAKRVLEEKRANIIRDWLRDKAELESKTNVAWEQLHKEKVKKLEKSLKIQKQREICIEWAARLAKIRVARSEQARQIQMATEPFAKEIEREQKLRLEKETNRKAQVKSAAGLFKEKKLEEKMEKQLRKEEIEAVTKKLQKSQLQISKSRVKIRELEYEQKQQTKRAVEEKMEEEKRKKLERLEKIKDKVEIDYDPTNVWADTHATFIRKYEHQETTEKRREGRNDEEMVDFFRKRYSFAADTVWADRRVKVEAKLRDAGLMGSSYARQILLAMQPREKPHLKATFSFDDSNK